MRDFCMTSFYWYGSMERNMEGNFSMEWNMEWKIFNEELVIQNLRREPH